MRKEARLLLDKAFDSLTLSVEHFNRPWDQGRVAAVLILLDHSFEMLLKAAILHKRGRIREPKAKQTIGFDKCVRIALSDGSLRFLEPEQALLLQTINMFRDAAYHHLLQISEQMLYIQAQAGLTLFRDLLQSVFDRELNLELPDRVLPLSTTPPMDLPALFAQEVGEIKRLLQPGTRRRLEASNKIQALAIMEGAIQGETMQPGQGEIRKFGKFIKEGRDWQHIFPGVASINISAQGHGPSIELRITKKEGAAPMQLVPEGTPGAIVAIKTTSELDRYSLGLKKLAEKVRLSAPKTLAVIWHLKIQEDPECFKEITVDKVKFKRYSMKALDIIKKNLKSLDMEEVWRQYKDRSNNTLTPDTKMP